MSVRQWGIKKVQAPGMLLVKCWLTSLVPRFNYSEEVACLDEYVGFWVDVLIYRFEEIVIDCFSRGFIPLLGLWRLNLAWHR
jgi:hypothetical protein